LFLGLLGLFLGLFATLLWCALMGYVMYLVLKLIAPETAARVRTMITGKEA